MSERERRRGRGTAGQRGMKVFCFVCTLAICSLVLGALERAPSSGFWFDVRCNMKETRQKTRISVSIVKGLADGARETQGHKKVKVPEKPE